MTTLTFQVGLPEDQRKAAAALLDAAFARKFAPIVPDRTRRVALLAECLSPEHALVALSGDRLVGLVGFHAPGGSFVGGDFQTVVRHLGVWGAARTVLLLSLFVRKPRRGELLLDGFAVDVSERGRGIGTGLLENLIHFARTEGYRQIRLDVVDTNPGARRLYDRFGFIPVQTSSAPYLERWFGFRSSTTMVKRLDLEDG
ncbi:MAG: GNAT family N-acetyltransferase [Armatimonadaceae bacterium]